MIMNEGQQPYSTCTSTNRSQPGPAKPSADSLSSSAASANDRDIDTAALFRNQPASRSDLAEHVSLVR